MACVQVIEEGKENLKDMEDSRNSAEAGARLAAKQALGPPQKEPEARRGRGRAYPPSDRGNAAWASEGR